MPLVTDSGAPGLTGWTSVSPSRTAASPSFVFPNDATRVGRRARSRSCAPRPRPSSPGPPRASRRSRASSGIARCARRAGTREGREAHAERRDLERHPLALADRSAARAGERVANRPEARLRRPVRVVHARLPARQRRLVLGVEEQDSLDGRLAEREPEPEVVRRRLLPLVHGLRGRRLGARVQAPLALGHGRLDPELVVEDRQRRARLGGSVECLPEQRDELPVVREPDRRRARMREVRALRRVVGIRDGSLARPSRAACARWPGRRCPSPG